MILREMLVDDLDQVMEIETDLFHVPWTKEGFFTFLTREDAMFLVVEERGRSLDTAVCSWYWTKGISPMWQYEETGREKESAIS